MDIGMLEYVLYAPEVTTPQNLPIVLWFLIKHETTKGVKPRQTQSLELHSVQPIARIAYTRVETFKIAVKSITHWIDIMTEVVTPSPYLEASCHVRQRIHNESILGCPWENKKQAMQTRFSGKDPNHKTMQAIDHVMHVTKIILDVAVVNTIKTASKYRALIFQPQSKSFRNYEDQLEP
ncbi:hypothetical protein VNO77_02457 [Canavalia gladiata]|uniref:Uncharacterized protein n=1 Tax=Canavalia gladiata TaxID=3824 RepID=A0AAN9MY15_CANGL